MPQAGDAGTEPTPRRGASLGVVTGQRSRQRPVTITSRHSAQQIFVTITSRHHPHRHRHAEPPLSRKGARVLDVREGVAVAATPSAASPPTSWIFSHSGGFAVRRSLGNATPLPGWNAPRGYAAMRFSLLRVPAVRLSTDLRPLHERFTTPTCRRRRPAEKASACRPPPFGCDVQYVAQSEYRPGDLSKPRSARGVAALRPRWAPGLGAPSSWPKRPLVGVRAGRAVLGSTQWRTRIYLGGAARHSSPAMCPAPRVKRVPVQCRR